jgi:hypothetical protein
MTSGRQIRRPHAQLERLQVTVRHRSQRVSNDNDKSFATFFCISEYITLRPEVHSVSYVPSTRKVSLYMNATGTSILLVTSMY